MSTDEAKGYVVFYTAPGAEAGDPVEDKLLRSHEAEAEKQGAQFWNYGKVIGENEIYSKTSKGNLESQINPKTMQVTHRFTSYEQKARDDEQFQRKALEQFGESLRDHVVRQIKPLREVYGDLTEFAPVWEATDKLGP